ncbi:MAG TPA: hypothetical protein VFA94_14380 [Acidimicrobiales bacterium]|nr:hypothetical protein [Acidimicrobiales bacterium]
MVDAGWERRLGREPESFTFDFGTGSVRLTFTARHAAYEVLFTSPLLVVRDAAIELPRSPSSLQLRAEGLWVDHNCETPLQHWSVGLEAFALAVAHVDDEVGDRVPFGLDLEWEASGPPEGGEGEYRVPAAVYGDVLVERDVMEVSATGWWSHTWARRG